MNDLLGGCLGIFTIIFLVWLAYEYGNMKPGEYRSDDWWDDRWNNL